MAEEKLRLDKYLWAIRMFKTRKQAADAIEHKKVRMNGSEVKPAKQVAVGDIYEIKREGGKQIIQVIGLLDKRMAYAEAVKFYTDITPEEEKMNQKQKSFFIEQTGKRQSKQGRPTKRNRRDLEELF